MYEREYRKLVLGDFEQKLATGALPPELIAPTRSSLRDHCIKVCKGRYQKTDEPLLKSFYGERNSPAEYLIAVQNTDAEEFRTLHNFLKRRKGTSFLNISMLAWMIDFEPRPFREDLKMPTLPDAEAPQRLTEKGSPEPVNEPPVQELTSEPEVPQPATEGDNAEPGDGQFLQEISTKPPPPGKKIWPWLAALLLVIAVTYYFIPHNRPPLTEGCMVWTGEQYQPVRCGYKPEDHTIPVIALDTTVLKHFRKIMKDDTLTANSIDKVWCVKVDGRYEYYTDSAAHPLHPEKILRHLTQYIMNNNPPSGK
ncbi:MAG: hypothetical protein JWR12_3046 [Mucilaginibacter sp.]|nr:hypothetical protein [Mucilaginibacter sp.]